MRKKIIIEGSFIPRSYGVYPSTLSVTDISNAYNSYTNTSSYAYFNVSTTANAYLYLIFDTSSIPNDATIDSVDVKIRVSKSTSEGGYSGKCNVITFSSGSNVEKYSAQNIGSGVLTFSGVSWTREELSNCAVVPYGHGKGTNYAPIQIGVYGATLEVTYYYYE